MPSPATAGLFSGHRFKAAAAAARREQGGTGVEEASTSQARRNCDSCPTVLLVVSLVSLWQSLCARSCGHVDTQSARRHKEDRSWNTRARNLRRPCVTELIVVSNVIYRELAPDSTTKSSWRENEGSITLHGITSWCVWINSQTGHRQVVGNRRHDIRHRCTYL